MREGSSQQCGVAKNRRFVDTGGPGCPSSIALTLMSLTCADERNALSRYRQRTCEGISIRDSFLLASVDF